MTAALSNESGTQALLDIAETVAWQAVTWCSTTSDDVADALTCDAALAICAEAGLTTLTPNALTQRRLWRGIEQVTTPYDLPTSLHAAVTVLVSQASKQAASRSLHGMTSAAAAALAALRAPDSPERPPKHCWPARRWA